MMRVLVADGDERWLEILHSFLWRCGYEAEVATDAIECFSILHDFQPDVVVLEVSLLGNSGGGIIAQIQQDPQFNKTPLIFVADTQEEFDAAKISRPCRWLQKPFRLCDLVQQLHSVADSIIPPVNRYVEVP